MEARSLLLGERSGRDSKVKVFLDLGWMVEIPLRRWVKVSGEVNRQGSSLRNGHAWVSLEGEERVADPGETLVQGEDGWGVARWSEWYERKGSGFISRGSSFLSAKTKDGIGARTPLWRRISYKGPKVQF